ncbi:MAG: thiolase family protein, partial [Armatimonadota bacterium]|nr:thiolase family protein [Armatimonadota bacterium]MDW8156700.1 thiolase family protein [Armatimonadota bacterium]
QSHVRAARATREGRFSGHLVPVEGLDPQGRPAVVEHDEGIRFEPSLERMLQLPPAFRPDGRLTAGNSSQISDGAAAVLVADREFARAHGLRARARFRARMVVAGDPTLQLMEVVPATRAALQRARLALEDVDVVEINEAFASVVLAWARELEPDMERVNPNGGAIAHGHPLGATGAVLMAKLLDELEQRDGQFGLQVMCIGHGMATATVLERVA